MQESNDFGSLLKQYRSTIIIGAVVALVVVIGGILFFVNNGVKNNGNTKEAGLNAQYSVNINTLSDCIIRIRESAGVVQGQTEAFDRIMTDAVKGRYDEGSSAQVGGGTLFSAITEAYPDLSGVTGGYDKVLSVVNGCRTDYRGMQNKLLDMIREYDTWRTGSWTVRTFGSEFPSANLNAKKGDQILEGKQALIQMKTIVVVEEANTAYETGTLEAEDPFGSKPG